MLALVENDSHHVSAGWEDFLTSARQVRAELQDWEQLLEDQFGELESLQQELERQAEATDAMQRQLAERQRLLEEERTATARLTHQLDQQDARLTQSLASLAQLTEDLKAERAAASQREQSWGIELAKRETAWQAERDDLRAQLAAAACTLPPPAAAVPAVDDSTRRQVAELQEERAVLEAELTLVRSRAADLQEQVQEQKRQLAGRQTELAQELKQLRETLAGRPWEVTVHSAPTPAAADEAIAITQPPPAPEAAQPTGDKSADPLVNSVMAQFARLQRDVAQRRKPK